jgi:HK97 family phage prohead protease/HK97 family phage major capsid protein
MSHKYDFCGWATRNDVKCSDGRTIKKNAFIDDDGLTVPLVWNHDHGDPNNVLGHALLKNRDDGVYAYCEFNDTESGKTAKELVKHGDVTRLSIYANKLKQVGGDVIHGAIKEVSLVLAGANPHAVIENVLTHAETGEVESAFICTTEEGDLSHSEKELEEEEKKLLAKKLEDEDEESEEDEKDEETEELKEEKKKLEHSEDKEEKNMPGRTVKDVFDEMSEEQKNCVYAIVGQAVEDAKKGGSEDMKHNVFESDYYEDNNVLSHADEEMIIKDGQKFGSLKESVLAHTDDYGIQELPSQYSNTTYGIDALFPDYRELNTPPEFLKRETTWVSTVMGSVHHTPFSRIKTTFADITGEQARALGYMKGNLKKEEVFTLLKRTTDPQTIYKKQKLDRDDIVDITSFDVVAWIKAEMRVMLDEEIARAILVGDGRLASSDDKIKEDHVRSVWNDAELYTIHVATDTTGLTSAQKAKAFITACIKARKDYKGSGTPTLFTTEEWLTEMLLLEDNIGRPLYESESQLATKIRVSKIVTVPVMENLTRSVDGVTRNLDGIIVNLTDYNVGADKGGSINLFDDFDIDYNQYKYLIETRISGALIKPKSAIALESYVTSNDGNDENDGEDDGNGEG